MKACARVDVLLPLLIPNLGAEWRRLVSLTFGPLYFAGTSPRCELNGSLCETRAGGNALEEEWNFLRLLEIEPQLHGHPARSLVTIQTPLYWAQSQTLLNRKILKTKVKLLETIIPHPALLSLFVLNWWFTKHCWRLWFIILEVVNEHLWVDEYVHSDVEKLGDWNSVLTKIVFLFGTHFRLLFHGDPFTSFLHL